ncbi:MAG TPA: citrate lyase subunit alpha, partial [Synergistaceae bacterium]|nr:citrate lyase subunit alpha [Synergistaceae bacterium]
TERGVAVNPKRSDLVENLKGKGISLVNIHDLKKYAEEMTGVPRSPRFSEKIIGVVEYRDGSVIDVIFQRI